MSGCALGQNNAMGASLNSQAAVLLDKTHSGDAILPDNRWDELRSPGGRRSALGSHRLFGNFGSGCLQCFKVRHLASEKPADDCSGIDNECWL